MMDNDDFSNVLEWLDDLSVDALEAEFQLFGHEPIRRGSQMKFNKTTSKYSEQIDEKLTYVHQLVVIKDVFFSMDEKYEFSLAA